MFSSFSMKDRFLPNRNSNSVIHQWRSQMKSTIENQGIGRRGLVTACGFSLNKNKLLNNSNRVSLLQSAFSNENNNAKKDDCVFLQINSSRQRSRLNQEILERLRPTNSSTVACGASSTNRSSFHYVSRREVRKKLNEVIRTTPQIRSVLMKSKMRGEEMRRKRKRESQSTQGYCVESFAEKESRKEFRRRDSILNSLNGLSSFPNTENTFSGTSSNNIDYLSKNNYTNHCSSTKDSNRLCPIKFKEYKSDSKINCGLSSITPEADLINISHSNKIYFSSDLKSTLNQHKKTHFKIPNHKNNKSKLNLLDWSALGPLAIAVHDKVFLYTEEDSPSMDVEEPSSKGKVYLIYCITGKEQTEETREGEDSDYLYDITNSINNHSDIDMSKYFKESHANDNKNQAYITHIKFTSQGDKLVITLSNGQIDIFDLIDLKVINTYNNTNIIKNDSSNSNNIIHRNSQNFLRSNDSEIDHIKDLSTMKQNDNQFSVISSIKNMGFKEKDCIVNYDIRAKEQVKKLGDFNSGNSCVSNSFNTIKWSEDDKLAVGTPSNILIFDSRKSHCQTLEYQTGTNTKSLSWSKNNSGLLISGGDNGEINLWNSNKGGSSKVKSISTGLDTTVEHLESISNNNDSFVCSVFSKDMNSNSKFPLNGIFALSSEQERLTETFEITKSKSLFRVSQNSRTAEGRVSSSSAYYFNDRSEVGYDSEASAVDQNRVISLSTSVESGRLACVCDEDGTIRLWNVSQQSKEMNKRVNGVNSLIDEDYFYR